MSSANESTLELLQGHANSDDTAQYLSFTMGEEEFCVDIMSVREIKGWADTTRLPNSPGHIRGVMNLRGVIIPIFDLRARFKLGLTQATDKHVVVILHIGTRTVGVLIDTVSDILNIPFKNIKPAPSMDTGISNEYIHGIVSHGERMVVILNPERLFTEEQLQQGDKVAKI